MIIYNDTLKSYLKERMNAVIQQRTRAVAKSVSRHYRKLIRDLEWRAKIRSKYPLFIFRPSNDQDEFINSSAEKALIQRVLDRPER